MAHARQRSAGSRRPSSATGSGADTGRVCGAWRCAAGGRGSVAGGFAAAMVVRCHRIIYRRGDARGARSVSGGSAADLGSAPDAVNSARERLGEGVYRCHCACGVIAAPPMSRSRRRGPQGELACLSAVSTVKHQGDFGPRERPHDRPIDRLVAIAVTTTIAATPRRLLAGRVGDGFWRWAQRGIRYQRVESMARVLST